MARETPSISHPSSTGAGSVTNPSTSGFITDHSETTSSHRSGATGLGLGLPNDFQNNAVQSELPALQQNGDAQAPSMRSSASQGIFPETRPVITPRIASLSAYQTVPVPLAPVPSSSSTQLDKSLTQTQQPSSLGHDRDFSYEFVEKAELHTSPLDAVQSSVHPGLNRSNSSVPSRPSKNPLRSAARTQPPEDKISISDLTTRAIDPDSTQMNRHPSSRTLVSPENIVSIVVSSEAEGTPHDRGAGAHDHKLQRIRSNQSGKTIRLAPLSTSSDMNAPPSNTITMPFYVLRQIKDSMTLPNGAFISQGLFVPRATWAQVGVKIPVMETKIRIMELLSESLEAVRKAVSVAGVGMTAGSLHPTVPEPSQVAGVKILDAALDDLEALTVEIQKILAKKLGDGKSFAKPRKSNTVSRWRFPWIYTY